MRTTTKRILPLFAATAMLGMFGGSGAALAEGPEHTTLEANLTELNDSGASGTAWVTVEGNQVTVKMENTGLLAGSPHAQHIHVGGKNQCPDPNMEGNGENGALQVSDAMDDYGMIVSSLTTEGDTSPDSGLAVERFPVGDDAYERTFEVSDEVATDIADGKGVIVVHGVDHNGSGAYDGDVKSDLDPSLPSEATDPAACGALEMSQMADMPEGGAETGDGTTAGIENAGVMVAGGGLIAAAFAGAVALRKRALQK